MLDIMPGWGMMENILYIFPATSCVSSGKLFKCPASMNEQPSPSAPQLTLSEVHPERLEEQLQRFYARCAVNVEFLKRTSAELHACSTEERISLMQSSLQKVLHICLSRRSQPEFPLWKLAGNNAAFAVRSGGVKDAQDIETICNRYIQTQGEMSVMMSDPHHSPSIVQEEKMFGLCGLHPPFFLRYDNIRNESRHGSQLRETELVAKAIYVDLVRAIAFIQSEVLWHVRRHVLPPEAPQAPDQILKEVQSACRLLTHLTYKTNGAGGSSIQASLPIWLGALYFELPADDKGQRPSFFDFLSTMPPESLGVNIDALQHPLQENVLHNVRRYMDPSGGKRKLQKDSPKVSQEVPIVHQSRNQTIENDA